MGKITRSNEKNLDIKRSYMSELRAIADAISKVLGDNFLGFYVMGSFVMGDWDPQKSDVISARQTLSAHASRVK